MPEGNPGDTWFIWGRGSKAVQAPRDLVQVDTLTVTLVPGEVVRHFSAVDLCTRYALAEVHSRATANLAGEFLSRLVAQALFPISSGPGGWGERVYG